MPELAVRAPVGCICSAKPMILQIQVQVKPPESCTETCLRAACRGGIACREIASSHCCSKIGVCSGQILLRQSLLRRIVVGDTACSLYLMPRQSRSPDTLQTSPTDEGWNAAHFLSRSVSHEWDPSCARRCVRASRGPGPRLASQEVMRASSSNAGMIPRLSRKLKPP